jgi:hypothetical protein
MSIAKTLLAIILAAVGLMSGDLVIMLACICGACYIAFK